MTSEFDESYPLATPNEVDLELPKNLLTTKECVLCGVKFTNDNMFETHIEGIKHQGKKSIWLRKQYEAMGINASGWLVNPVTLVNKQKRQQRLKRLETDHKPQTAPQDVYVPERGYREDKVPRHVGKSIGCPQCRVFFESTEHRALHKQTPHHALVIWELSKGHVRPGTSISIFASAYKNRDFQCTACDKKLASPAAWELHIASGNHLKIANRIKEHGDVVPKEEFVPKTKAEKRKAKKERTMEILARSTAEIERSVQAGLAAPAGFRQNLGPGAMKQHAEMYADCEPPTKKPTFGPKGGGKKNKNKGMPMFVPCSDPTVPASFGLAGPSFNMAQANRVQMVGMGMIDFSTSQPSKDPAPSTPVAKPPATMTNTKSKPTFGAMDFLDEV